MDQARRATLPSSRGRRNAIDDEPPTMVEHEVLGWPGVYKKLGSDHLEQQADPITVNSDA